MLLQLGDATAASIFHEKIHSVAAVFIYRLTSMSLPLTLHGMAKPRTPQNLLSELRLPLKFLHASFLLT